MKSRKFIMLSSAMLSFFAISQMVSCAGGQQPVTKTYSVKANSTTLDVSLKEAVVGKDFNAKIAPLNSFDDTYILPEKIAVSINSVDVDNTRYTYNNNTGDFSITAANLIGNVVITAEADKITKSVGDYAHIYVGNRSDVSFEINDVAVGDYFISGVTHAGSGRVGQALKCFYTVHGDEVEATSPLIHIDSHGKYNIRFETISKAPINDYVTATLTRIVDDPENFGARFNIKTEYNKKCVAFRYNVPINFDKGPLLFQPIIVDKENSLADIPLNLQPLFPGPVIANKAKNFAKTTFRKEKASNNYYIAASSANISLEDGNNFFIGYFDNIVTPHKLEISSLFAATERSENHQIKIKDNAKDLQHNLFVRHQVEPNTSYCAYNENCIHPTAVYDGETLEEININKNDVFTTGENDTVFVVYELNKSIVLSNYNINEYKGSIVVDPTEGSYVKLTQDDYNGKSLVLGAIEASKPICSLPLEGINQNYSHIIKIISTNDNIISAKTTDSIYAYSSERSGDKTNTSLLKFGLIASEKIDDKYVNYYAPLISANVGEDINYLKAPDSVNLVTLDKIAIPFNNKVEDEDRIYFTTVHPITEINLGPQEDPHVSYSSYLSLNVKNAFVGVPYTCKITSKNDYREVTTENVTVKIDGSGIHSGYNVRNGILTYKPSDMKSISISASPVEKQATLGVEASGKYTSISCIMFVTSKETIITITCTKDWQFLSGVPYFASAFPAVAQDQKTTIKPIADGDVDFDSNILRLKFGKLDIQHDGFIFTIAKNDIERYITAKPKLF